MRCNSKHIRTFVAAIALVNNVGGERVALDIKKVSGTLKALLRKLKC
jgi:RNase P/RNase MRP subunit POP5